MRDPRNASWDSLRAVLQCRLEEIRLCGAPCCCGTPQKTHLRHRMGCRRAPASCSHSHSTAARNLPHRPPLGKLLDFPWRSPPFRGYPLKAASPPASRAPDHHAPRSLPYATRNLEKEYPEFAQNAQGTSATGCCSSASKSARSGASSSSTPSAPRAYYDSTRPPLPHRAGLRHQRKSTCSRTPWARALRQRLDAGADFAELAQTVHSAPRATASARGIGGRLTPKHSKACPTCRAAASPRRRYPSVPLPYETGAFVLLRIKRVRASAAEELRGKPSRTFAARRAGANSSRS
jgi:hypothetical protein